MVEKSTNNKHIILNLYRSDYSSKYHVREMAKLLKKSHVTLLPHLKLLEKEKVLLSKTEGKNRKYSLNFENIITKKYMLFSEIVESINFLNDYFLLKRITSEINKLNLQGTIVLFGSYAKRTFNKDSDIDLFYIGHITPNKIKMVKKIGRVYRKTINIKKSTNFESALKKKDPLIIEIIKNHIILQNTEKFIDILWRYYYEKR